MGRAIVACGWLDGWSRGRVRDALGAADRDSTRDTALWLLGDDRDSLGPSLLELRVRFDARGHVVSTKIVSRPD